jgi:hypothetical protein
MTSRCWPWKRSTVSTASRICVSVAPEAPNKRCNLLTTNPSWARCAQRCAGPACGRRRRRCRRRLRRRSGRLRRDAGRRRRSGIAIDIARRVARLEPGLTWGAVAAALQPHGLALTSGDTASVGVGGLTLGGGIGWMARKYGLTIDHLRSVELVTAEGEILTASAAATGSIGPPGPGPRSGRSCPHSDGTTGLGDGDAARARAVSGGAGSYPGLVLSPGHVR